MYQPEQVTFTDPRKLLGTPYEVADQAIGQADGILQIYEKALEVAYLMARNAEMERNLATQKPAAGDEYLASAQGKKFQDLWSALGESRKQLKTLRAAASFDPKHPPRVG